MENKTQGGTETIMTGRITPSSKHILSVFSFSQNRLKLLHAACFVRNAGACARRAHAVCVSCVLTPVRVYSRVNVIA